MRKISCLFLLIQLTFAGMPAKAQSLDTRLLKSLNGKSHNGWDQTMRHVSFSVYLLEPVVPVSISLHGHFTKDKEILWNGYKSAISLCGALAISTGLKYSLHRTRPFVAHAGYIEPRDSPHTPSFPSGHTTAAFVTATSLTLSYKKWYVAVPAYTYAGVVAYSRMRLGVHYPSDVLAGMVLGTGSALLTWHIHKMLRKGKEVIPMPTEQGER
jgi:membrane-associated phospholipid phosphatase